MITPRVLIGLLASSAVLACAIRSMWLGLVILIVIFVAEWRRPAQTPVRIRVKSPGRIDRPRDPTQGR